MYELQGLILKYLSDQKRKENTQKQCCNGIYCAAMLNIVSEEEKKIQNMNGSRD